MYAAGIDSGTQGTKAVIVAAGTGRVVGRGYAPHAMVKGLPPGASEQAPGTWIKAMEKALRAALRESRIDPGRVTSLGVSGQQHGFVPLDRDGRPIRPAKLWNDTSTIAENEALLAALGGRSGWIRRCGIAPAVGFTASKILWLRRREPESYARLATVLLPHNYLNYRLTGRAHMEFGDASGTGLMDVRRTRWSRAAAAAVDPGVAAKLPPLSHPREPAGWMLRAAADRFGFGRVLVSAGGGDNMMGAIGTGNVSPGVCTLSLGTSGTIYAYSDRPFVDARGEIAAFCDSTGGWLPLLCTMNVTNATGLLKSLLRVDNAGLERLARSAAPGASGLIVLPFIDGERVPVLPAASGVVFGLDRRSFDARALARSVMEGAILNLGYGFGRMKGLGLRPTEIRATGGGSRSRLWLRIAADVFQTPVRTLREQEAAAFGAALQSIWCRRVESGDRVTIAEITGAAVKTSPRPVEPDPRNFALYEDLRERFDDLWKSLTPAFGRPRAAG